MAGVVINKVQNTLGPISSSSGFQNAAVQKDAITLLARKTLNAQLHWRETAVAQMLFTATAPVTSEASLLRTMVEAQLHDVLEGRTSIAKVRAALSELQ